MEWTPVGRWTSERWIQRAAVACAIAAWWHGAAANAQPANDTCVGAIALTLGTPFSGNNAAAGSSGDGAAPACQASVKSGVFFTYTPSLPGVYRVSLCDSPPHDTVLTVFAVSSCQEIGDAGRIIACNDDSGPACGGERSSLDVPMQAGVTYLLRVQTWSGGVSGAYVLRVDGTGACCRGSGDCFQTSQSACTGAGSSFFAGATCSPYPCVPPTGAPANNACESATVIDAASLPASITGTTASASSEGQSGCGTTSVPSGRDVFYRFTPGVAGTYQFSLCGSAQAWDSLVSVHTGCPASIANQVAGSCNNTASPACDGSNTAHARSIVTLAAGTEYVVRIAGGTTAATGSFTLDVGLIVPGACCRPNGDCTFEPTPLQCQAGNVYVPGSACSPYPCTAPGGAPANNLCENAQVIPPGGGVVTGTAAQASSEGSGCGIGALPVGKDVFFRFTPTLTGSYRLSLCGSGTNWDSVLSVHEDCPATGANLAGLPSVACNDTASPSCGGHGQINAITLEAGRAYVIRVGGAFNATTGAAFTLTTGILGACCATAGVCSINVQASCPPGATFIAGGGCSPNNCPQPASPTGDTCGQAIPVPSSGGVATATLLGAAVEGILTGAGCGDANGRDVYFRFTPEADGAYRFSTCESAQQDTVVSLHSSCPTAQSTRLLTGTPGADCAGDGCSGGQLAQIAASPPLSAGQSVIIRVGIASATSVGDGVGGPITLRVTRLGACCRPEGSCTVGVQSECTGVGSTYLLGAVCAPTNPCPTPAPPPNDACVGAEEISTTGDQPFAVQGTVAGATTTDGGCGAAGGLDVFFRFTPPTTGAWTFSLCASGLAFDSTISVHTGCPAVAANLLACDDDACGTFGHGRATANLVAGVPCVVRVGTDGLPSSPNYGPFTLRVSRPGACCAPSGAVQGACTVVDADRCTGLSVFLGPGTTCTPTNPCPVSGACCFAGGACYPTLPTTCAAPGVFAAGSTCVATCTGIPAGDACAQAIPLQLGVSVDVGNTFATSLNDGPAPPIGQCAGNDAGGVFRGMWFSFTPTHTAGYRVSACGSSFDTLLLAYQTTDCSGFTLLACDDNACAGGAGEPGAGGLPGSTNASVIGTVVLSAGTTYALRAQSFSAFEAGNIRMRITPVASLGACCLSTRFECTLTDASRCSGLFVADAACGPEICPTACCRGATCALVIASACVAPVGVSAGVVPVLTSVACNGASLTSPCCIADYNKIGGVTVLDILDYLNDWFQQSPLAATGTDGTTATPTVAQLFNFLDAWFAGCP